MFHAMLNKSEIETTKTSFSAFNRFQQTRMTVFAFFYISLIKENQKFETCSLFLTGGRREQ
jgi:hypothetical protein